MSQTTHTGCRRIVRRAWHGITSRRVDHWSAPVIPTPDILRRFVPMYTTSALAVMLLIAAAFWGYGRTVQKLCAPAVPTDVGTAACLGLAVYLAACGFIELTASASPALLIGIIVVGLLLAAIHAPRNWGQWRFRQPRPHLLRGWGLVLALVLVAYLAFESNAAWWHFVNNDDTEGYLVMPLRLLQTGSTGLDPFLFRRVEAGLGGNNYLYALP